MPNEILAKADAITPLVKIIPCALTVYTNNIQHLKSAKLCLPLPGDTDSVSGRAGFQPSKLQKHLQPLQTLLNRVSYWRTG